MEIYRYKPWGKRVTFALLSLTVVVFVGRALYIREFLAASIYAVFTWLLFKLLTHQEDVIITKSNMQSIRIMRKETFGPETVTEIDVRRILSVKLKQSGLGRRVRYDVSIELHSPNETFSVLKNGTNSNTRANELIEAINYSYKFPHA